MLARQLDAAGHRDEAATARRAAAAEALEFHAYEDALAHAQRGLKLSRDPALRLELAVLGARAADALGNRTEQRALLKIARSLAESSGAGGLMAVLRAQIAFAAAIGDAVQEDQFILQLETTAGASGTALERGHAHLARARYLRDRDLAESLARAQSAADYFKDANAQPELFEAQRFELELAGCAADFAELERIVEELGKTARALGANAERRAIYDQFEALVRMRRYDEAESIGQQALDAASSQERESEANLTWNLAVLKYKRGNFHAASELAQRAGDIFSQLGLARGIAQVTVMQGHLAMRSGRYATAIESYRAARRLFERIRNTRGVGITHHALSLCYSNLSEFAKAKREAEKGISLARASKSANDEADALFDLAVAFRGLGKLQVAYRILGEDLKLRRNTESTLDLVDDLSEFAEVTLAVGKLDEAAAAADQIEGLFPANESNFPNPQRPLIALALVRQAQGKAQVAREFRERALAHYRRRAAELADDHARAAYAGIYYNRELMGD